VTVIPGDDKFGLEAPQGVIAETRIHATVLFCDIRNLTPLAERLSSGEMTELLTEYFRRSSECVLDNGGRHLKFVGNGLMSVFADTWSSGSPLPATRRAVSAALGMALAAHEFRGWMDKRFAQRGLPPFAIGVGLHAGEVAIEETTLAGDTVNVAARLEAASKELGWTVVASSAVLADAGEGIQTGGMTSLSVRGKNGFVDVAEITGLVANVEDKRHGMVALSKRAAEVRDAVRINSEITARAVTGALQSGLPAFKGYRLGRKIGSGGMTELFLAVREADSLPVVLKVLNAGRKATAEHLARFIQEFVLLSSIEHPHVIRIYDQGFAVDRAYIAMEYFERGDLRTEIAAGLDQQRVVDIISQTAQALAAIHARGIVHCDVKPGNIMLRPDGSVALADFGIAKSMLEDEHVALTQAPRGDVVGTPYYLSPEQVSGKPTTPQSDLYSLGVTMFEMLAGERPFRAESLELLLARHLSAPAPSLAAAHAALQPVVEKLMAKRPRDRYASAQALLQDLAAHGFSAAVSRP
jgi:serine/threonine-protein kinase PpkA